MVERFKSYLGVRSGGSRSFPPLYPPEYGIVFQQTCTRYILDENSPVDLHYINGINGNLHLADAEPVDHTEYCLDYVQLEVGFVVQKTFVCFREDHNATGFLVYAVGLCISCVFLAATLIVYACLPKVS